ncbi:hypothetical protein [Sorangium sp. So ce204]|uniref:hypothetical protein n=1 Tax=Sorangium sp. So ce204 TaxID=3133288 RepID=UPI003F5DF265
MALLDEIQRKRVAYHEAAHAVLAVAQRFLLVKTLLTRGTTTDRSVGGFTDWWDVDPLNRDEIDLAEAKAHVFYAGEYAERHLAAIDRSVWVPAHDANWDIDESHAAEVLALVLQTNPHADARVRRETAQLVRTY